jgi:hypothetical protein
MTVARYFDLQKLLSFAALCLIGPGTLCAQAPAGPIPAATPQPASATAEKPKQQARLPAPRPNIFGAWKFNSEESDDARKKMQDARGSEGGGRGGLGGGHGRVGGGYPGGGRGRYGGRGGESDSEREKMHELFKPAQAITLSMTGAEVDLVDDQNRKRAFMTDGRKLQKSKDENNQEVAARWDGNRLVSDEKGAHGGKMSRGFELSADGRQLYETLHLTTGRSNTPLVIRYVYDITEQSTQ